MPDKIVINNDILVSVEETERYGTKCIKLNFQNSSPKYQDIKVFDKTNSSWENANALIGKSVQVTCWDPIDEPGKWSNDNWYKDIFLLDKKIESSSSKFNRGTFNKGPCSICGKEDFTVCYSEDGGNSWMHYVCRNKNK